MSLPTQAFYHATTPSVELFEPIKNQMFIKPLGGMWTSSFHPKTGSDWVKWCVEDGQGEFASIKKKFFKLNVNPDARIFTVDSVADLKILHNTYALKHPDLSIAPIMDSMFSFFDYERIGQDFDAIHLTKEGQNLTRFSRPSLYGWDVESTLWLNWKFISISKVRNPLLSALERR